MAKIWLLLYFKHNERFVLVVLWSRKILKKKILPTKTRQVISHQINLNLGDI